MEEYQHIDRDFNRKAATEWGLSEAQWLFTRVPCAADLAAAREVGIRGLPGWWHNLVGIAGGFLHNGGVVCSLRADDRPGYLDMQPLAKGWHTPAYETLRDAPEHTDCVLLWGVVGGWPEEYEVGALGLWAWEPAAHDWSASRDGVYGLFYGPAGVPLARRFDEPMEATLSYARRMAQLDYPEYDSQDFEPAMVALVETEDTAAAQALLEAAQARILPQLARIRSELAGLKGIDVYAAR